MVVMESYLFQEISDVTYFLFDDKVLDESLRSFSIASF